MLFWLLISLALSNRVLSLAILTRAYARTIFGTIYLLLFEIKSFYWVNECYIRKFGVNMTLALLVWVYCWIVNIIKTFSWYVNFEFFMIFKSFIIFKFHNNSFESSKAKFWISRAVTYFIKHRKNYFYSKEKKIEFTLHFRFLNKIDQT
jgi:hypothetical protein